MDRKIKSITIERHDLIIADLHSEELELKARKYKFTEYNTSGNITKEITWDPNETIEESIQRDYKGSQLLEERYFDEHNEIAEKKTFEYDEAGKLIAEYKHYLDGSIDTISYIYNDSGKLVKKILKDEDEIIESAEYFEYQQDYLSKWEIYDDGNRLIVKNMHKYDDKGNVIENTVYNEESGEDYREYIEYNDNGIRTKSTRVDQDNNITEVLIYETDANGKVVQVTEESPIVFNTTNLEYDDQGNLIKQEEYNKDKQLNHRIERSYDEDGNTMETKVFVDLHGEGLNRNYILNYTYEFF